MLGLLFYVILTIQLASVLGTTSLNDVNFDSLPPLYALEDHGRCVRQPQGLYCLVEVELYSNERNKLIDFLEEYSSQSYKHFNHSIVDRGICVTKTCSKFINGEKIDLNTDLTNILQECLNDLFTKEYGLNAKLFKLNYCDKHGEENTADTLDIVVMVMILFLVFLNLLGSTYDLMSNEINIKTKEKRRNDYLTSFSIFRNWKLLISESEDSNRERLKGLYGIKSIMVVLVIFSHVLLTQVIFSDNVQDFVKNFEYHQVLNLPVAVQIYYVMTSFLLAYNLSIREEKHALSLKSVPKLILLRFARLAPAIALMIAFLSTWQRHLNSGPLWKINAMRTADQCRISWWKHLLFLTNYNLSDVKHCAPYLWYAASDMQLYIFGLILYMVIRKLRVIQQTLITLLLITIGSAAAALQVWLYDLDGTFIANPEFIRTISGNDNFFRSHVLGHINLPGFVVGVAAGMIVSRWQRDPAYLSKIKEKLYYLSWTVIPGLVLGISSGWLLATEDGGRAPLTTRMVFSAFDRVFFATFIAIGIACMPVQVEGPFSKMLAWPFWRITSRLSYAAYVFHMNVILVLAGSRTQLSHIDMFFMMVLSLGVWVMSHIVALIVYLFVEAPVYNLTKKYLFEDRLSLGEDNKED